MSTAPLFLVDVVPETGPLVLDGPEGRHAATVKRLRVGETVQHEAKALRVALLPPLAGPEEEVGADDHRDHRNDRPEQQQDVLRPHASTRSRNAIARSKVSIRFGSFWTV